MATSAIARDVGGTPLALAWITNAFMLSFGSLLMAAGALADQYGRKRVFGLGLGLFVASSLALACTNSIFWLDGLRALQGVAAAATLSSGSAALAQAFEGHARDRAFALLGVSFGLGLALGPVMAGALIASFGWRAIFAFIAMLAFLSMLFGLPKMQETRDPDATGLDRAGAGTFTLMLALLTFSITQVPARGWGNPWVIGLLAGACVLLASFVAIESRVPRPMLDLSLFRYPRFIGVQLLPMGTCCCYIVLVVLLPIRYIGVQGLGELRTGWLMLALSAPMLVVPLIAARLARRVSAGILSGLGFLIAAMGLHWLSTTPFDSMPLQWVAPLAVIGIGTGLPWGLMDGLSVSVVPKERAGMATGIFSTTRVAGEGIALAVVGAVLAGSIQAGLQHALLQRGFHPGSTSEVAQRLAAGELHQAAAMLNLLPQASIKQVYAQAFQTLLDALTGITIACAAVAFGMLNAPSTLFGSRPLVTGDQE